MPALQEWCHQLALPVREAATERLLVRLRAFADSLRSFIEDSPGIKSEDRDAMISQWESPMDDCSELDFRSRPMRYWIAEKYDFQGVTWHLVNVSWYQRCPCKSSPNNCLSFAAGFQGDCERVCE